MILYDIMIHCSHYFSVQCLSYEANYSHCFLRKLSLKWNFSSGVSDDTLVYSFAPQTVTAAIGACNCSSFMISAIHCQRRVAPFFSSNPDFPPLPSSMLNVCAFKRCHACGPSSYSHPSLAFELFSFHNMYFSLIFLSQHFAQSTQLN